MAGDDVEFGHVVDLTLGDLSGTELVADAAIGATSLVVDYAGDFEDTGDLSLNDEVLTYTSITYGDAETDPDIIELATPLATAAATDDKVGRMSGGEQVTDWMLHVSLGDGHPVDIPIPFEQRAMWSSVDTSTPVPVFVSADLERLVEVPGRVPHLDPSFVGSPLFQAYLPTNGGKAGGVNIPNNVFSTVDDWDVATEFDPNEFDFDAATGVLTLKIPGTYLSVVIVRWTANTSGRRQMRIMSTVLGADTEEANVTSPPPDDGSVSQQLTLPLVATQAGTMLRCEAFQNSGGSLALQGSAAGKKTLWRVIRVR